MPHLESTIKTQRIMCLKKLIENYQSPWKLILSHHLKNHGDKFLLHCNYDVADLTKSLPKFYRDCFEAWAALTQKQPSSRDYVMEKPYLALINRAGGLYVRILTEVVNRDRTQWGLYTRPRSRFSHTDRLSSVNKMFIIWRNQEQFNSFNVTSL